MSILYTILGTIMGWIDIAVSQVLGYHSIGWCIILFTIIMYALMIPLNAKQQKSSRLINRINPEIKAIQDKYQGKKDNDSMMKMNAETQAIYTKYGVSPFGGCLPLLISLPIMFALYGVIREIEKYAPGLANEGANIFLHLNVSKTPMEFAKETGNYFAYLIPVLATVFQFANTLMLQPKEDNTKKKRKSEEDSMAQSMKMMNYFMPLMSGFFCLTFSIGIGLYWITGSIFRIVQAYFINRHVDKISLDDLIEKNKHKAAKKEKKREEMNRQMEMYSKQKTSSIKTASSYNQDSANRAEKKTQNVNIDKNVKPGSISGYANMSLGNSKDKK